MKTSTYLLVDFENLQPPPEQVALVPTEDCHLWLFHGPHQNKFSAELVKAWKPLGDRLEFIQSGKTGRNALDFHIAFYLGLLHERNVAAGRPARYVIVTGDGGFDAILSHMVELGCAVAKAATIPDALAVGEPVAPATMRPSKGISKAAAPALPQAAAKRPAAKTAGPPPRASLAEGDVDEVIAKLREYPKNRPADRKALERYAVAALGNKVTPQVGKAVVNNLEQRKVVSFDGTKAAYKIPKTNPK